MSGADVPDGFLWGAAAAAHQVEGQNVSSDWWAFEHAPHTTAGESSGDAIDHLNRYREDFALLASLGHNAHRLSLEWARIEPVRGEPSRAVLAHYRRVLEGLHELGMTPVVTLHHFTNPQWFAARGGWTDPRAVDDFARHAERVGRALGDLIPYACTVNEPSIVALYGHLLGEHPPGLRHPGIWRRVTRRLQEAHRAAVAALGETAPQARAGICLALPEVVPARPDDAGCRALADELRAEMEDVFLDDPAGDFIGVQYYSRQRADPARTDLFAPPPPGTPTTQMGWELHPEGLMRALRVAARAGLPLIVTENGIATEDDAERVDYLESHLDVVRRALADGLDVRGYLYWSAWDNFEWAEGFRPRFGLIGIDRDDDLRRVVRPSAEAFARVIRTGRMDALRAS